MPIKQKYWAEIREYFDEDEIFDRILDYETLLSSDGEHWNFYWEFYTDTNEEHLEVVEAFENQWKIKLKDGFFAEDEKPPFDIDKDRWDYFLSETMGYTFRLKAYYNDFARVGINWMASGWNWEGLGNLWFLCESGSDDYDPEDCDKIEAWMEDKLKPVINPLIRWEKGYDDYLWDDAEDWAFNSLSDETFDLKQVEAAEIREAVVEA